MDPTARLRPAPRVVVQPEEDEVFLFEPETGALKLLNRTGAEAWRLLDGERDAGAVAAAVAAGYADADPAAVAADVRRFLDELVAAGLAEVVPRGR